MDRFIDVLTILSDGYRSLVKQFWFYEHRYPRYLDGEIFAGFAFVRTVLIILLLSLQSEFANSISGSLYIIGAIFSPLVWVGFAKLFVTKEKSFKDLLVWGAFIDFMVTPILILSVLLPFSWILNSLALLLHAFLFAQGFRYHLRSETVVAPAVVAALAMLGIVSIVMVQLSQPVHQSAIKPLTSIDSQVIHQPLRLGEVYKFLMTYAEKSKRYKVSVTATVIKISERQAQLNLELKGRRYRKQASIWLPRYLNEIDDPEVKNKDLLVSAFLNTLVQFEWIWMAAKTTYKKSKMPRSSKDNSSLVVVDKMRVGGWEGLGILVESPSLSSMVIRSHEHAIPLLEYEKKDKQAKTYLHIKLSSIKQR